MERHHRAEINTILQAIEMDKEVETYKRQGFGAGLGIKAPLGLLIIDFTNGFADPNLFGGGNIAAAITQTAKLLAFGVKRNGRLHNGDDIRACRVSDKARCITLV